MNLTNINKKRAATIEQETGGEVQFLFVDDGLKSVKIETNVGPIYITLDSYCIKAAEHERKTVFNLSYMADLADEKVMVDRQFDTEHEREIYIETYCTGIGIEREELILGEVETEA